MAGGSDSTQRNLLGSLERQANVADSGLITPAARVSQASTFGEQSLCKTAETTGDMAASIIAGRLLIEGSGETRLREQLKVLLFQNRNHQRDPVGSNGRRGFPNQLVRGLPYFDRYAQRTRHDLFESNHRHDRGSEQEQPIPHG